MTPNSDATDTGVRISINILGAQIEIGSHFFHSVATSAVSLRTPILRSAAGAGQAMLHAFFTVKGAALMA